MLWSTKLFTLLVVELLKCEQLSRGDPGCIVLSPDRLRGVTAAAAASASSAAPYAFAGGRGRTEGATGAKDCAE